MAIILDTVRGTNAFYLVVNGDPAAGAGTKAGIDSLAIGPTGITYQKTGLADTAWIVVASPAGGVSSLNTLTGAVILAAGTNIVLTPVGNTITIDGTAPPLNQRTVIANDTILASDDIIFVDTSGGPVSLTLPNPTTVKPYRIIDSTGFWNTNNVTLIPFAGEMIEGLAANKLLQTDWGYFELLSNTVDWFVD